MPKPKSVAEILAAGGNPSVEETVVDSNIEEVASEAAPGFQGQQPTLAPTTPFDQNALSQLLQYLILKEGREAAAAQQLEDRYKAIKKQRDRNAKDQDSKVLLKQARCRHLKGGKRGPKTQNRDYAVYKFRFIDFSMYIRCRICGMRWFPKDTVEYLYRNGHKISNHTHKGWRDAIDMTEASTDTEGASEAIPNVTPQAQYQDSAGLAVSPRVIDIDTGKLAEGVVL